MSHPEPLSQWMETVSSMLPKLSHPQARVLAYWSYGMVLARSCGTTLVCVALALQVDSSEQSSLQRLREWCYNADDKKGQKRCELDVSTCLGRCSSGFWRGGQCARALDGDRAFGSRLVCALAVYQDRVIGLAPVHAHQHTGQFPPTRRKQVSQAGYGSAQRGQCLVWAGGLFFWRGESLAVHAAGSASMRAIKRSGYW